MSVFPEAIDAAMTKLFGQAMAYQRGADTHAVMGFVRGLRADETVGSYEQADAMVVVAAAQFPANFQPVRLDRVTVGPMTYTVQAYRIGFEGAQRAVYKFIVRGGA